MLFWFKTKNTAVESTNVIFFFQYGWMILLSLLIWIPTNDRSALPFYLRSFLAYAPTLHARSRQWIVKIVMILGYQTYFLIHGRLENRSFFGKMISDFYGWFSRWNWKVAQHRRMILLDFRKFWDVFFNQVCWVRPVIRWLWIGQERTVMGYEAIRKPTT